jgi:hypothetical protein
MFQIAGLKLNWHEPVGERMIGVVAGVSSAIVRSAICARGVYRGDAGGEPGDEMRNLTALSAA